MQDEDQYLTVHEIAKQLKVGDQAVRRWIKSGDLPAINIYGQYRIRREDFEKFLAQQHEKPYRKKQRE